MLEAAGRHEEASAAFEAALGALTNDGTALYNRGLAFVNFEPWDRAVSDLRRAIDLTPSLVEAQNALAWAAGV